METTEPSASLDVGCEQKRKQFREFSLGNLQDGAIVNSGGRPWEKPVSEISGAQLRLRGAQDVQQPSRWWCKTGR